ncbi:hypothetical protein ACIBAG_43930 [Streptomyces sp. NPDC051243]|uniref:hypothetical protein n=1 Tax=Streptomyces sp. NPDC051243 TaxID=3365646 RepID=UPI0037AA0036
MLRTIKTAGVATVATLALTGVAATPATASVSAQARVTSVWTDCDHFDSYAEGLGYQPGQTIVVSHEWFDSLMGDTYTAPDETLTVKADGTWQTKHEYPSLNSTYYVTVKDTQGTELGSDDGGYCGIW